MLCGIVSAVIGLFAVRKRFSTAHRMEKLTLLGRVFLAAPLAVFGA
jgi:hypothetical protein